MEQSVRVLIADAQVPVRQGLRALLAVWPEIVVAGMAANTGEIVQMVEKCQPDVVLLNMFLFLMPMPQTCLKQV